MVLFADETTPATVWAVIASLTTVVGGIIVLVMKQRHAIQVRKLEVQKNLREELARQKAQETQDRNAEIASMKKAGNEVYQKWRDIADMFRQEKNTAQKMYEDKCAECIELRIHLEEAKKRLGESHD